MHISRSKYKTKNDLHIIISSFITYTNRTYTQDNAALTYRLANISRILITLGIPYIQCYIYYAFIIIIILSLTT